ncbi:hypothetical protein SNE40_004170 [Patella caerulea]|uniref:Uncharacterized protein n=1 Tax=Patella caerulea TaxID=87958 RepID=A0AAN8KD58_PATCE
MMVVGKLKAISNESDSFLYGKFPAGFKWGAATAAYQIEGGYNIDGKGPNIWDVYVQQPGNIQDNSTGNVACDSYHKYKEDVNLLHNIGANSYRFSISWSRIMPSGSNTTNPKGINYYKNLIGELKKYNITPMVTLYHNDLPEQLQRYGGWLNEEIVDLFAEYARVCFREFGDDVKYWITLNEPWGTASLGYGLAIGAPGVWGPGTNTYIVGHNMIKAHAAAYHVYTTEFKSFQQGEVGITLNVNWFEPLNINSQSDLDAQDRGLQFLFGWFAHPIFANGDYPDIMKALIRNKTEELTPGSPSRLPTFSPSEIRTNKGTADFLGLNFYSSTKITSRVNHCNPPTYDCDSDTFKEEDTSWNGQSSPSGLRKMLNWIKREYNDPTVYITENGAQDKTGTLVDTERINYMKHYINEALKAIKLDNCNLKGYLCWSLMDNFEWISGFSVKFGLHHVNFTDPNRTRTPKASSKFYANIIKENGFLMK